jgi:hypothetical protein
MANWTSLQALLRRFSEDDPTFTDNTRAYFHNDLGFKPGQ